MTKSLPFFGENSFLFYWIVKIRRGQKKCNKNKNQYTVYKILLQAMRCDASKDVQVQRHSCPSQVMISAKKENIKGKKYGGGWDETLYRSFFHVGRLPAPKFSKFRTKFTPNFPTFSQILRRFFCNKMSHFHFSGTFLVFLFLQTHKSTSS